MRIQVNSSKFYILKATILVFVKLMSRWFQGWGDTLQFWLYVVIEDYLYEYYCCGSQPKSQYMLISIDKKESKLKFMSDRLSFLVTLLLKLKNVT